MKSINALRALEKLPSSARWYVVHFDCYSNAEEFCFACFGEKAIIREISTLTGHDVLITSVPLLVWCDEAPIYDAVVLDPDGYQLHDLYIYTLED